jgi:uncharacterized protein involved in exopolysaccharide biosynthesis
VSRDRPVWFRNGAHIRNRTSPVTWQGWTIASAAVAGIVSSLFLASQLAPVRPVASVILAVAGIGGSITGYIVALFRYGDARDA